MTCEICGGNLPRVGACKVCEMLAFRAPPRGVTDDTRFAGFTKVGGAQFKTDEIRNFYLGEAKAAGVDVSGKQYFSELAAFPGDPRAWLDNQGDQRRLIEERGWGCEGDLKVKARDKPPPEDTPLAEDLMEDLIEDRLFERHGPLDGASVSVKEFNETRDAVIQDHGIPQHLRG